MLICPINEQQDVYTYIQLEYSVLSQSYINEFYELSIDGKKATEITLKNTILR